MAEPDDSQADVAGLRHAARGDLLRPRVGRGVQGLRLEGLLDGLLRRSVGAHGRGGAGRGHGHLLQLRPQDGRPGPPRRLGIRLPGTQCSRPGWPGWTGPSAGSSDPSATSRRCRPGGRDRSTGGRERHRRRPAAGRRERGVAVARGSDARPVAGDDRPAGAPGRRACGRSRRRRTRTGSRRTSPSWAPVACPGRCCSRPGAGATRSGKRPSGPWWRGAGWRRRTRNSSPRSGAAARQKIEDATDRMAVEPWERIGDEATDELRALLKPMAGRIAELGLIPTLNPIGLPPES